MTRQFIWCSKVAATHVPLAAWKIATMFTDAVQGDSNDVLHLGCADAVEA